VDVIRDSAQVYLDGDAECDRPRFGVALPGVLAGDKPGATTTHMAPNTGALPQPFRVDVMLRHTGVATEAFPLPPGGGGGGGGVHRVNRNCCLHFHSNQ
jgi:hypothetical protein